MPSPFSGMDPYIESQRNWSDFHADLGTEIRARLNAHIQPDYYATAVTYIAYDVIEIARKDSYTAVPDVGVWRAGNNGPTTSGVAVLDVVIDPPQAQSQVTLEAPFRLSNVEVRQAGTDRLVTAIEILSPINKRTGREREKYLRKRRELFLSEVHVMEIDLLRGGQRSALETPPPPAPYYVTLGRANQRPTIDVWAIQLDTRLPVVPIPLLAPDPDIALDLGAVVRAVYERGAYATRLDYREPVPSPALDAKQLAWVDTLLTAYRKH